MCCNKASLFDSYDSIKKFDRYLIGNRICKKQCIVLMRGQSKDLWILVKGEAKDDLYNRKASFLF